MQIIVASKGSKAALTYGITELLIDAITPHDGLGKQFVALLEGIQKDLRVIIKEEVLENMTNIAKDILEEITAGLTKQ